jgi:hypothetical protein
LGRLKPYSYILDCCKEFPAINTLAYFPRTFVAKKKVLALTPGPNVIKLHTAVIYKCL